MSSIQVRIRLAWCSLERARTITRPLSRGYGAWQRCDSPWTEPPRLTAAALEADRPHNLFYVLTSSPFVKARLSRVRARLRPQPRVRRGCSPAARTASSLSAEPSTVCNGRRRRVDHAVPKRTKKTRTGVRLARNEAATRTSLTLGSSSNFRCRWSSGDLQPPPPGAHNRITIHTVRQPVRLDQAVGARQWGPSRLQ
jgi:hypothetical protein